MSVIETCNEYYCHKCYYFRVKLIPCVASCELGLNCHSAVSGVGEKLFKCDRRCNKKKHCGRHRCAQLCCVVSTTDGKLTKSSIRCLQSLTCFRMKTSQMMHIPRSVCICICFMTSFFLNVAYVNTFSVICGRNTVAVTSYLKNSLSS